MENETDNIIESQNNEPELDLEIEETPETPKEEPKVEKPKRTPEEELKYHEGRLKRLRKDLGLDVPEKPKEVTQTGELDDTQLDYLDLKGITEEEDIKVIQSVMKKTGQTVRQALKDDYVIAKLKDLKVARDVKTATPSATKRSGQQATDNEDYWYQKYEASGEMPKGMPVGMAAKLIHRKASQSDTSIPAWQR